MKVLIWAAFLLMATGVQGDEPKDETVELRIPQGQLKGKKATTPRGHRTYHAYHRIPFAKPPVGNLRFKDPEFWEAWDGVLDATKPIPMCPQEDFVQGLVGQEDCLYLNVYTPVSCGEGCNLQTNSNLPVMVFIHGGGFYLGNVELYDPEPFMDYEVVIVSIQYRLGTLGFFSTEDSIIPGNFGLKDQTMALRWVQSHISYFGGDPLRVTIFGESAGGASVHYHMLSPSSSGLFSKAIIQSGSALASWALRDDHRESAMNIAQNFNCSSESIKLLKCLQAADAYALVQSSSAFQKFMKPNVMTPRVDGWFLPDEPEILMKEGRHNQVDVISGHTSGEGAIMLQFLQLDMTVYEDFITNFEERGSEIFGFDNENTRKEITRKVAEYYMGRPTVQADDKHQLIQMYGDREFTVPHDLQSWWNVRNVKYTGKRTFLYDFAHVGPFHLLNMLNLTSQEKWNYSYHGDDLYYHFNFADDMGPEELKLRDLMLPTWVNFATYGNPTPDDSLGFIWEEATEESMKHLVFVASPYMEDDQRREVRDFWTSLPMGRFCYLRTEDQNSSWFDMVRSYIPLAGNSCTTVRKARGLRV